MFPVLLRGLGFLFPIFGSELYEKTKDWLKIRGTKTEKYTDAMFTLMDTLFSFGFAGLEGKGLFETGKELLKFAKEKQVKQAMFKGAEGILHSLGLYAFGKSGVEAITGEKLREAEEMAKAEKEEAEREKIFKSPEFQRFLAEVKQAQNVKSMVMAGWDNLENLLVSDEEIEILQDYLSEIENNFNNLEEFRKMQETGFMEDEKLLLDLGLSPSMKEELEVPESEEEVVSE